MSVPRKGLRCKLTAGGEPLVEKATGNQPNARCNEAFAELITIYHAEHAHPVLRQPVAQKLVSCL